MILLVFIFWSICQVMVFVLLDFFLDFHYGYGKKPKKLVNH